LVIKKRRLHFANTVAILQRPDLLLKIFLESGQTRKSPCPLKPGGWPRNFRHLVDDEMQKDPRCVKIFKRILALSYWEFNVLNVMLSTGILHKVHPGVRRPGRQQNSVQPLPPVSRGQTQHPVRPDHQQLQRSRRPPWPITLYACVQGGQEQKRPLVAALLHDIGKSDPAKEHSNAGGPNCRPILDRLDFNPTEKEDILFLIENHPPGQNRHPPGYL
jgi:[protein-PII] uridylyltransferase